jgi:transposase InsO family protein
MSATMSPSALKPFGIMRFCAEWNISRSTIHRYMVLALYGATPKKKRGPKTCLADAQLFEEIKIVLRNSTFVGEGYRKVDARLCSEILLFCGPRRILRIMRESDLLAPTRRRSSSGRRTYDGAIVTQRPDEMWDIDGTSCMTDQGSAIIFVVIDHCTGECLEARAAKCGTRHEAIDTLRQGIRATRGTFDRDVAAGVALRHDHGSQYISHTFQDGLRFVGIRSSPSFVRCPEGNGCVERFIRTLKEQLLWLTRFAGIEELHAALQEFVDRFNNLWILGRLGYKTPAQRRRRFLVEAA